MSKYTYSHHSSPVSDDHPDVDSIVSQAIDLCALEQIAALNTCHLSDPYLPTDVEARFRKLKSFPGANPQPITPPPPPQCLSQDSIPRSSSSCQKPELLGVAEAEISPPSKPDTLVGLDAKPKDGFGSSPSVSLDSSRDSPSPPRQTCCFGCSPKRGGRTKEKGDHGNWGKHHDDFLSDIRGFTSKEQQRKLKKALKEHEKASQEAEKMVKWVKQVSARMNASAIDELLSKDEEFK